MPGTSVASSPPLPAATRAFPAYALPAHTLRIFGACALPLVLWFSAGRAVRAALMWTATEVAHGDHRQVRLIVTMMIFVLIVLTELVVAVGMLRAVRGTLREIRVRRAENEADEGMFGALERVTLLFATVYLAWGFHEEDARELVALDTMKWLDHDLKGAFAGIRGEAGILLAGLDLWVSAAIAAVAYALRTLFGLWHAGGRGRGSGLLAALAELAFAFYGLNMVFALTSWLSQWLADRVAAATAEEWLEQADRVVPGFKAFREGFAQLCTLAADALVAPLAWLAIAALVYGAFATDTGTALRGTRLEAVTGRMDHAHKLTRGTATVTMLGFRERWLSILNAFRLVAHGGAVLSGMFCLCHVALRAGAAYADRGVRTLVGSDFPHFWLLFGGSLDFVRDLAVGVLTVCLLAATFDIAATRGREAGKAVTA
ncbi:hypothetical protein HS041_07345 [Planomonospora sp. ID67723]|uniref:hypothetical protein n=1 Tax=Planomonospora sp. ID67723 TaxID=2738134 RepID=UPI0018C36FAA|nr:hypothetical protein [Planomonospora sp. ID67723]MBG0827576.1 hypothetical protein [Planomonospora sp. ID67723]